MEDLVYIGIFLIFIIIGKVNVCMNLWNLMKECFGMCDSFMLMNFVFFEFWCINYFYYVVCNIKLF